MVRPVVFLSDYGYDDEFAGICRGVIAQIAPDAAVIELTHAIPPQNVLRGATVLSRSVRYMPTPAVYLAIVDPEVGTSRRAVAVETAGGSLLVGPDNGLLSLAWEELGGAARAVEITSDEVTLQPRSATFHGRDVFSPAAAHLAAGMDLGRLGPELAIGDLTEISVPAPIIQRGLIAATVLAVDRFGNIELNARGEDLERAGMHQADEIEVTLADAPYRFPRATTFAELNSGSAAVIVDSAGHLAVVINEGSASAAFGVGASDQVVLALPGSQRVG